jgi:hypothetical protein
MSNILLYLGTGGVLLSILYMLAWASAQISGAGKDIIWNENVTVLASNLLPLFIRNGFLLILSGLIIGLTLLLLEWNYTLLLLGCVPVLLGLIVLFEAWHIRQGLLYGAFFRLVFEILKMPRIIHRLFLFQLLFWMVLFVCWINPVLISPVYQTTGSVGSIVLIAILSSTLMLKLKKIKND